MGNFSEIEVLGMLQDRYERVLELDLILSDHEESYSMNVMTLARYQTVQAEQLDIGYDKDASRVFIVNEDSIVLDALGQILTGTDTSVFKPYLYKLTEE